MTIYKSQYLEILNCSNDQFLIYNRLFPDPLIVNYDVIELLGLLTEHETVDSENDFIIHFLSKLKNHNIIWNENNEESAYLDQMHNKWLSDAKKGINLRTLILNVDTRCNMNCSYCNVNKYKDNHGISSVNRMTFEMAKSIITSFADLLFKNNTKGLIVFFGGEPLLSTDLILEILFWAKTKKWKHIFFSINTNGTLLTKNNIKQFKSLNCSIAISLDGLSETNDMYRKFKNESGSFAEVEKAIILAIKNKCNFVVLTTIHPEIFSELMSFYKYLFHLGVKNWSLKLPTFENNDSILYTSNDIKSWVKILYDVINIAQNNGMRVEGIPRRKFIGCEGIGRMISVNPDGSIFPCPGGIPIQLGHVSDFHSLITSDRYLHISSRTIAKLNDCKNCSAAGFCAGSCAADAMHFCDQYFANNSLICDFMRELVSVTLYSKYEKAKSNDDK